jgi:hypothetical protein
MNVKSIAITGTCPVVIFDTYIPVTVSQVMEGPGGSMS